MDEGTQSQAILPTEPREEGETRVEGVKIHETKEKEKEEDEEEEGKWGQEKSKKMSNEQDEEDVKWEHEDLERNGKKSGETRKGLFFLFCFF